MLHASLPLDFTPGDPVRDAGAHEDFAYHAARQRAVAGTAEDFASWKLRENEGLALTLNTPRRTRGTVTMVAKWRFCDAGHPSPWGGDIRFRLETNPALTAESRVLRAKVSKSACAVEPALQARDIALLDAAITLLMEQISHDRPATACVRALLDMNPGLGAEAAKAAGDAIAAHEEATARNAETARRLRDSFSEIPDGTPIIIRKRGSSPHGARTVWQLGFKKGRASDSLARHAMIAPEEILRGDALRQAGLSAHDALPLLAAAARARPDHPGATFFRTGSRDLEADAVLHPGQPFHQSFLDARRDIAPSAWMQTIMPSSTGIIYEVEGPEPDWWFSALGHRLSVLPKTQSGPVTLREKHRYKDAEPARFAHLAHLWCVTRDVAEILTAHEMGGIALRPVEIADRDGNPLAGDWSYLATSDFVNAVDTDRTDKSILTTRGGRTVQPYEIVLRPGAEAGLDIWFDDSIRSGVLFFSDRLYQALKRARALPRIALKPCR